MTELIIQKTLYIANGLVGTRESGNNRGKTIDEIQRLFGLQGQQYCVMFVLWCYYSALRENNDEKFTVKQMPLMMTPSSQMLYSWAKKNGLTYSDPRQIRPGDIIIWRKFKLWQGHAGLAVSGMLNKESTPFVETIEGNTQSRGAGDQPEGQGIFRKKRTLRKIDFSVDCFYLRGFINITKCLDRYFLNR